MEFTMKTTAMLVASTSSLPFSRIEKKMLLFNKQHGNKPNVSPIEKSCARTASFTLKQSYRSHCPTITLQQKTLQSRDTESGENMDLDLSAMTFPNETN